MTLPPPAEVTAGGQCLSVRRLGAGPRLVFLHGGPGLDHHLLLPLATRLVDRFEVWLPDLPGHGDSQPLAGEMPDLRITLERLGGWLRSLTGGPGALAGHSLGAWLARELVRRGAVRPRALVLISPPAAGRTASWPSLRRPFEAASSSFEKNDTDPTETALRELLDHVRQESRGRASSEFIRAAAAGRLKPAHLYGSLLRQFDRALQAPLQTFDPGCPALVLCGGEDRTTSPDQAEQVAAATKGAEFVLLDGVGHYPFAERAEETVGRIADFLQTASDRHP